jgi:hypothetical protein
MDMLWGDVLGDHWASVDAVHERGLDREGMFLRERGVWRDVNGYQNALNAQ